jgi:hypothetical protein
MAHYNNKYKKEYMSNLARQNILSQSSAAIAKQQLYASQCYSNGPLSSAIGPRSYQAPQAGDGFVYTRVDGIVIDRQPIFGNQSSFHNSTQEDSESDDDSESTFNSDLFFRKRVHEEHLKQMKKIHEEEIKQYQQKLDDKKEHVKQLSINIQKAKETYDDKLKKQLSIQKELKELIRILELEPIEFKTFDSIEIDDDLELYLEILTIQTSIINEENDKLLIIMESCLS